MRSSEIDNLQMFDDYSFISVHFRAAEAILKAFSKNEKKNRPLVELASAKTGKSKKEGFKTFYKKKR